MRKPRKVRTRSENYSSDSLIAAELLERRYAFTATPLFDEFTSAAMEAVARGELTSERWIVHKLSDHELSIEGSHQSLTNFGGNAGWNANPIGKSFFRLETSGIDSSDIVEWARNHQDRFLVEPDLPIQVEATSNDPSLWRLYGLNNYGQSGGTTDADIDAPEAWDITTGSRDVVIGVIDSGVDVTHPDLAANIWVNPGETPNNGIDDDGNGFIDDVNGWDFYDDDNTPNDGNGHGTHVAGTIGAVGNNSLGITGVNWEVSLLPLRFLGNDGSGWTSDAVAAVNYATMLKRDFGINVVATNNSWGGGGYSRTLDRAIEAANDEGIMFVAAAGNEGNNNDTNPRYPTNYDAPNVISVAALNRNDNLAGFSNYGATTVDVGAPGVSIYSTLPGNSYGSFSGTSMAAPHVAGVVGLLNAAKPGISVTEVSNAILGTVDTLQSLDGKTVSGGRVNAAAALTSILGQAPSIDPLDDLILSSGQTQNITVAAYDLDGEIDLAVNVTELVANESPASITLDGSTLTVTSIPGVSGVLEVTVIATDLDQNSAFESFTVEVLEQIESQGSVALNRDVSGKLYANTTGIQDPDGKHISTSHYTGWKTLAAETINGVNNVLWEYTPTGQLSYWNTDESWSWTSSFGEYYDGSTDYYTAETQFGVDVNQDGTIGAPELSLTQIESEGSVTLSSDASGKLYANTTGIQDPDGKHISTSHYTGWKTLAAETINGVNNVLWEYTPTGQLSYWNTDESWSWTSSFGEYYDGSTDYYTAETQFGVDVNQDGTIGAPELSLTQIESEGSVTLSSDASGKLYANTTGIQDPDGKHISTSHYTGWKTLAAETINGVNNVLWEYTPTGQLSYWNTDESWSWTSSFGEYYDGSTDYYTAETQFGVDVNQDGTIGAPELSLTQIESEGSVTLSSDASGKLYANETSIQDPDGKHISTSHYTGWKTLAAETINGVNNVLWEYTPTGQLSYWNTDESWSWTSSFGEYYDGSTDYYTAETQFGVDVNQDGTIGAPELSLTQIESEGSVTLSSDASGKLYANETSIQDPDGKHISTSHYTGWKTLAAETINGVNNVLWEYTPTGQLSYWNTDESWSWTSSFGEYYDGSTDYYTAETQFGVDVNQDGTIGAPELSLTQIESEGSVTLSSDASGKLYANETSIQDPDGKHISTSHYTGWKTLAAETINGVNNVLWEYTPTGQLSYWNTDESWSWTSSFGEYYDGSTDYYTAETQFGVDVNQDGTIGAPELSLTQIESEGSVTLSSDASGKLYANETSIQDPDGKHISTSHYTGWKTLAAETINGVNNVLWEYTPTGQLSYWNTDESWSWTSSFGEYYDGSTDYYTAETRFGVDVNQDGTIGAPELSLTQIESEGSVTLSSDASGKLYANETSIQDPDGKHISTSHYTGWKTLAAETINGVNNVLWEYTPTGQLSYWNTDESWSWTSSFGEYYDGSTDYYTAETRFGVDVNQDGTIGAPVTTDLQSFPSELLPGTSIADLPVGYETSGLTWHQGLKKIFAVSDEGIVSMMNRDGTELVHWNLGGDFEAVTVADHESNFIYIGVENPDSVIEFDVSSGQITRTFSLTNWMTGPSNLGLEALTFVPDATHPEGGRFYAGLQSTGEVFRFDLSIKSSPTVASVTFIDTLTIEGNHTDIADLSYDPSSDRILAVYDSLDRIKVIEKDGELRTQWVAPGSEQEAILYVGGELFIGEDFGSSGRGTITRYSPFTSIVA